MSLRLKRALVHVLLRLQVPPFLFVFRCYYRLAAWAAARSLGRVPGVEAVYLAGSLAAGHEVLYGISDVDLIVFMRGSESHAVRSRIDRRTAWLRRLFPMLGADRKAVYFLDDFPALRAEFPILQHLFDPLFCRYRWLRGRDVIQELALPPLSPAARRLSVFWKLKYWTEKILLIVCSRRLTPVQQHYALFKAMDDVARLMPFAAGDPADAGPPEPAPDRDPPGARGRWLEAVQTRLDPEAARAVALLLEERRAGFRTLTTDLDALLTAFWNLLALAVTDGSLDPLPAPGTGGRIPAGHADSDADPGTAALESAPAALRALPTRLDTTCRLRPLAWTAVTAGLTDCDGFGRPAYLLAPDRPLLAREIHALKLFQEEELGNEAALFVQADPHLIHAVSSEMMEHWLYTPVTEPHVWLALNRDIDADGSLPATALGADARGLLTERLEQNRDQVGRLFASPEITLTPTVMHARLVFTALSRLVLEQELGCGRFTWPSDVDALTAYLVEHTAVDRGFLDRMREAYREAETGAGSNLNRFFPALHTLVLELEKATRNHGSPEAMSSLATPPEPEPLTLSVIVITRNRCRDLERCLEAILRVRRRPDEILVVDNGSTDDTRQVVERLGTVRPIRYLFEPKPGVAHARNTGSRAANGDILAFMDDDAVPSEAWLESIENAFARSPAIGIVGGAIHHHRADRDDWITTYYGLQEGTEPC